LSCDSYPVLWCSYLAMACFVLLPFCRVVVSWMLSNYL
jgi:hypothetical protein